MSKNPVYVRKGNDAYSVTRDCLEPLSDEIKKTSGKKILLKPNMGRFVDPNLGINTSPEVIKAVIDTFIDNGAKDIIIGESPILGVKVQEVFKRNGLDEIAASRGIKLLDLDVDDPVIVDIPDPVIIDKLKVCRGYIESEYIVSIPVMKTHMHTQVSLSLKNMKGCLYKKEKVKLHQLSQSDKKDPKDNAKPLDIAIADMSKVLMPDLVVIDGMTAQEGLGPSAGNPNNIGIVVASNDCLAADCVSAELMGYDIDEVQHLRLALQIAEKKQEVEVEPEDYLKWKKKLKRPPEKISLEFDNVAVDDKDSCSACLSTVLMFLTRFHGQYADYFCGENPLKMAIGKKIEKQTEDTLLIGNCTIHQKECGLFVKGCPPVASDIKAEIEKIIKNKEDL